MYVCVHVCMCVVYNPYLEPNVQINGCTFLKNCTNIQAGSEVSGDVCHLFTFSFKETVYKAVVDGDLARCRSFLGEGIVKVRV